MGNKKEEIKIRNRRAISTYSLAKLIRLEAERSARVIPVKLDKLRKSLKLKKEEIIENYNFYESVNIKLSDYKEFIDDKYYDGTFEIMAKKRYTNREGKYEIKREYYILYEYAIIIKRIYDLEVQLQKDKKVCEYNTDGIMYIMKVFYFAVHKELLIKGNCYEIGDIGIILINRFKVLQKNRKIDFTKTAAKKEELLKAGKKIFNKEEANWCKERGIEYDGEDYRVFLDAEYGYEIALINCKLPIKSFHFDAIDSVNNKVRQYGKEKLFNNCKSLNDIAELDYSLKHKITMAVKFDKSLALKYIRNETQKSYKIVSPRRKSR